MSADSRPVVACLMGPTASGKTDLALELAARLPVDLVSVDSAMVYRGMDIGTAKPDAATLARVPHALIDIRDPAETYSAGDFVADARAAIAASHAAGRLPLLVGGTMLYFRALQQLDSLPAADPALRARLRARREQDGLAALHGELARLDPQAAARIHANDAQRIERALELIELGGAPVSAQYNRQGALPWQLRKLVLAPPDRAELHARIARRVEQMIADGLVDEVAALAARPDLHPELPALKAVGYRQFWPLVTGRIGADEAREKTVIATRQLAKRQFTWLRKEPQARWYEAQAGDLLAQLVKELEPVVG